MTNPLKRLMERAQSKGGNLLLFLGLVSTLGFFYSTIKFWFNLSLGPYPDVTMFILIGVGLIMESNIKLLAEGIQTKEIVPKLMTFTVGLAYLVGGIIQLPQLGIDLTLFNFWFGVGNLLVLIVIGYEVFIVK